MNLKSLDAKMIPTNKPCRREISVSHIGMSRLAVGLDSIDPARLDRDVGLCQGDSGRGRDDNGVGIKAKPPVRTGTSNTAGAGANSRMEAQPTPSHGGHDPTTSIPDILPTKELAATLPPLSVVPASLTQCQERSPR